MKYNWKANTGKYANGSSLMMGRIRIAIYEWSSMKDINWTGRCTLPGLRDYSVNGEDETEIRCLLETKVTAWFKEVGK